MLFLEKTLIEVFDGSFVMFYCKVEEMLLTFEMTRWTKKVLVNSKSTEARLAVIKNFEGHISQKRIIHEERIFVKRS